MIASHQIIFRRPGNWLPAALARLLLALLSPAAAAADEHAALEHIEAAAVAARTDPEASRRDAERALALLEHAPDADLEIRARLLLCDYYSERDRAAAEREVAAATALLARAARRGLHAGVLACQGEMLETAGENARARTLYEQAVAVAAAAKDQEMLALALFQRGFLLGLLGDYAAGLSDLRRAQELYQAVGMPHHALTALNGIATLYNRMGDYAQAREIYSRALRAQIAAGMRREQAVTQHNLARALERLGEWEAARQAFAGSLEVSRGLGYPRGEAYALRGLAAVANANGDHRGALEILARAAALQRQTPDERLRGQISLARGIALHRLGRLGESIAALEEAHRVFREGDSLHELEAVSGELAAVHAVLGNWRAAYEWQSEAKQAAGRLLRNQLDQRFTALKIEFDTATKEKENAQLARENAASARALAQARSVRQLQAAVIALTVLLAALLAWLALQQRRSRQRMQKLAMTDELTGVPNRRAVLGQLESLLTAPGAPACSILIIDVDHFKSINDTLGHAAGDEVLKVVAQVVDGAVRPPASFGRLGGEEFLIVLPNASLEAARQTAESFRERIRSIDTSAWFADGRRITASIGVTSSIAAIDSPSGMLQRADAALYAAKRAGRNCVRTETAAADVAVTPAGDARQA